MSLRGVPCDACDTPRFPCPIVRPIGPTSLFFPDLDFRHEPVNTVPFISSIGVPFIPSIGVPFIPSIRIPFIPSITVPSIPHLTVPTTSKHQPTKQHKSRKQTGSAYLDSQHENLTCRGKFRLPDHYGAGTTTSQPTLLGRQEYEPISITGGQLAPSLCSPRYLSGRSSQGRTEDLPNTDLPLSFPQGPLVVHTDITESLAADDSAMEATAFATAPVTHVATAIRDPSPLRPGQSDERVHGPSSFPDPSCAEPPDTASGGK